MAPKSIFLRMPLSLDSIKLGRLVLNTRDPQQEYQDPPAADPPKITICQLQDFEQIRSSARASKFRSRLAGLLSQTFENRNEDLLDFSAAESSTYLLNNTNAWFKRACGAAETREWLEQAIEGGSNIYLVVGYHTLVDARFTQRADSTMTRLAEGGVQASVGPPGTAVVDLSSTVGGGREVGKNYKRSFGSIGEQIYAVQYRKLKFKWFSSRSIQSSFLEPNNRWKICSEVRGDEEDDEDDVVEVEISEDGADDEDDESDSEDEEDQADNRKEQAETDEADERYVTEGGETEFVF